MCISGVAGLTRSSTQSVTEFVVSSAFSTSKKVGVSAIVVPCVTRDLPLPFDPKWNHLTDICLADPYNLDVLTYYWESRSSLISYATAGTTWNSCRIKFGLVLAGNASTSPIHYAVVHHSTLLSCDDILRRFWEIEEKPATAPVLSRGTYTPCTALQCQLYVQGCFAC